MARHLVVGPRFTYVTESASLRWPGFLLPTNRDLLHRRHVTAELLAHDLHWVRADGLVHGVQLPVVDTVVATRIVLRSDHVDVDLRHEVAEQRLACLVIEVAAVLGGVRNDAVHLEELLAGDRVGDQRRLVEALVVGGLRLHADVDHRLEGELHARLHHRDHQHRVVKVLLLWDVDVARRLLLKVCLSRLRAPLEEVLVIVIPVGHHGR
mmetsp:Transcript_45469/g.125520  ORF Transcript_45469/g.125520 Transcript_45469/m.125520 type:complete len:209 (-) Transcript_45469:1443-2069(-)